MALTFHPLEAMNSGQRRRVIAAFLIVGWLVYGMGLVLLGWWLFGGWGLVVGTAVGADD
jgi:hypothetical protein